MKKMILPCLILLLLFASCSPCSQQMKRIGILSALPQELRTIEASMTHKRTATVGDGTFVTGTIGNVPVVATLSGMGKVNAAVAAQRLISNFNASAILFTGVAGGINENYEIGDIVLGMKAFQHDFGFLGNSFTVHTPGILPEIGIGKESAPVRMDIGTRWPQMPDGRPFLISVSEYVKKGSPDLMDVTVNAKKYTPIIRNGTIATGDQFIAQNSKKNELKDLGADLVEMEGASVAQVAAKNGIPCLIVRSISDKAGEHANLDFETFFSEVAENNASIILSVLRDDTYSDYIKGLLN